MTDSFWQAYARYLRLLVWATVSGIVAGVVVLGIGSRLAMRLLAATSDASVQGAFTDDGEEIGSITLDGTIGLLIFVGVLFGVAGGWAYALLRPVLPSGVPMRRVAAVLVGAAAGAVVLVDPDGRDFTILEPAWLAVLLFILVPGAYGYTLSVVADRLRPRFDDRPVGRRWWWYAPAVVILPFFPIVLPALVFGVVAAALNGRQLPEVARRVGLGFIGVAVAAGSVLGLMRLSELEHRGPEPADFVDPFEGH